MTVCHTFVGSTGISLRPEELEHLSSVFDTYVAKALNTQGPRSSERSFESLTLFPPPMIMYVQRGYFVVQVLK